MARPGKKWLDRERNGSTGKANPVRGGSLPPLPPRFLRHCPPLALKAEYATGPVPGKVEFMVLLRYTRIITNNNNTTDRKKYYEPI